VRAQVLAQVLVLAQARVLAQVQAPELPRVQGWTPEPVRE